MQSTLELVLRQHSLVCGTIFTAEGEVLARAGDFARLSGEGLVSTLLGPRGSTRASYGLLAPDERIRPAMMEEGREFALLERVGPLMVIVFGLDRSEGMEHLLFSRQVGASIAEHIKPEN